MGAHPARRYIVERYLPGTTQADLRVEERRVTEAVASIRAGGTSLVYLGSTFIPEEETCLARFEGLLEGVEQACRLAGLDFARIVEVEEVEP
jgi:hypothetical protein